MLRNFFGVSPAPRIHRTVVAASTRVVLLPVQGFRSIPVSSPDVDYRFTLDGDGKRRYNIVFFAEGALKCVADSSEFLIKVAMGFHHMLVECPTDRM